ncbi:hypothetical protein [Mesorhizobium sp. WSM3626]|uniref:hypothetical protein n=1 Tax=Mesorhizobium sp. WSM3626 TaxID=1040987 RepID=UPI0012EBF6D7|nr:hypothetical protein [Mesorhizobium sp. WSM3626]
MMTVSLLSEPNKLIHFVTIRALLFIMSFLLAATLAPAFGSELGLSYIVDSDGNRIGATLQNADGLLLGEIFVDSEGNVGFIDCGKTHVIFDLAKIQRTSRNCKFAESKWSGSIYRHIVDVKKPIELQPGQLSIVVGHLKFPKVDFNCASAACRRTVDNCVACEPIDPTDPTGCLLNPACDQVLNRMADFAPDYTVRPSILGPEISNSYLLLLNSSGAFQPLSQNGATALPSAPGDIGTVPPSSGTMPSNGFGGGGSDLGPSSGGDGGLGGSGFAQ